MRPSSTALAAAVVLVAMPADAAVAPSRCHIPAAHAIARGTHVVVLRRQAGDSPPETIACLRRTGVRRRLDRYVAVIGRVRVRRWFVAYEREDGCYDACRRITAMNVRSGRRLTSYPAYEYSARKPLLTLVLDDRGRVAWIRDDEVRELRKMDRDGEDLLATGAGIDPASLRVDRGTVRWTGSGRACLERLGTGGRCTASNTSTLARSAEVRVFWRHEGVFGCHLAPASPR